MTTSRFEWLNDPASCLAIAANVDHIASFVLRLLVDSVPGLERGMCFLAIRTPLSCRIDNLKLLLWKDYVCDGSVRFRLFLVRLHTYEESRQRQLISGAVAVPAVSLRINHWLQPRVMLHRIRVLR
jgi:hypothetical protein